ncbi:hypothetical protein Q0F99_14705 [Rathayibacter oskolensis]|uniref:hypothetical protein n=1 Tax=Rathayibacter oskolensis TaxID=1891671 RepID=UPI00265D70C3|nr:hypothetical protein [Rathayibacter oskolensis]WKK70956.1 hypothetical protein Q0F99_14705 [Rathayibacter oskolensis]
MIEQPGPVFDTLGTSGEDVPLISIPDETTYPTTGALDMLTVSVVGNPQSLPNWVEVASAWFDRTKAVVPVEQIFPATTTVEERDEANQAEMTDSQQEAIAAALTDLGYPVTQRVSVAQIPDGSPSTGVLEAGDEVIAVEERPSPTSSRCARWCRRPAPPPPSPSRSSATELSRTSRSPPSTTTGPRSSASSPARSSTSRSRWTSSSTTSAGRAPA